MYLPQRTGCHITPLAEMQPTHHRLGSTAERDVEWDIATIRNCRAQGEFPAIVEQAVNLDFSGGAGPGGGKSFGFAVQIGSRLQKEGAPSRLRRRICARVEDISFH